MREEKMEVIVNRSLVSYGNTTWVFPWKKGKKIIFTLTIRIYKHDLCGKTKCW